MVVFTRTDINMHSINLKVLESDSVKPLILAAVLTVSRPAVIKFLSSPDTEHVVKNCRDTPLACDRWFHSLNKTVQIKTISYFRPVPPDIHSTSADISHLIRFPGPTIELGSLLITADIPAHSLIITDLTQLGVCEESCGILCRMSRSCTG